MTQRHVHYEILCALALSGQLREHELADLQDHAQACALCRSQLSDFAHLSRELFTTPQRGTKSSPPKGMLERFQTRAVREGIPLTRVRHPVLTAYFPGYALSMALVFMILAWNPWSNLTWRHAPAMGQAEARTIANPQAPQGKSQIRSGIRTDIQPAAHHRHHSRGAWRVDGETLNSSVASSALKPTFTDYSAVLKLADVGLDRQAGCPLSSYCFKRDSEEATRTKTVFESPYAQYSTTLKSTPRMGGRYAPQLWIDVARNTLEHSRLSFRANIPALFARDQLHQPAFDVYQSMFTPPARTNIPRFQLFQSSFE